MVVKRQDGCLFSWENSFDSGIDGSRQVNKIHHRHSLTRTHKAHIVTRALNAEPVCRLCQLIINEINSRVFDRGPEKLHEAGAHREISRFPGGPVRHWWPVAADIGAHLPFHLQCYILPPMCQCPISDIIISLTLILYNMREYIRQLVN